LIARNGPPAPPRRRPDSHGRATLDAQELLASSDGVHHVDRVAACVGFSCGLTARLVAPDSKSHVTRVDRA
jgi:hypothetical protein